MRAYALAGGLLALLASAIAPAKEPGLSPAAAPGTLIDRLDAAQQTLKTLSAEFTQKNRIKLFRQELVSTGRLYFERGAQARLRWDYISPDPSTLLLTGQQVQLKMPGRPVQTFDAERDSAVRGVLDQIELWLGNGSLRRAQKDYDITQTGTAAAPRLVLIPRATTGTGLGRTFSKVELRFDGPSALLRGLLLIEKSGDEKEILFTRMDRNVPLPDHAFSP